MMAKSQFTNEQQEDLSYKELLVQVRSGIMPAKAIFIDDIRWNNLSKFTFNVEGFIYKLLGKKQPKSNRPILYSQVHLNDKYTLEYKRIDVSHDGYDSDGPESDLYEIYIIIYSPDIGYGYFYYHGELWYGTNKNAEYELVNSFISHEFDIKLLK